MHHYNHNLNFIQYGILIHYVPGCTRVHVRVLPFGWMTNEPAIIICRVKLGVSACICHIIFGQVFSGTQSNKNCDIKIARTWRRDFRV